MKSVKKIYLTKIQVQINIHPIIAIIDLLRLNYRFLANQNNLNPTIFLDQDHIKRHL